MTHPPGDRAQHETADHVAVLLRDALADTPYDAGPYIARAVATTRTRRRRSRAAAVALTAAVAAGLVTLAVYPSHDTGRAARLTVATAPPTASATGAGVLGRTFDGMTPLACGQWPLTKLSATPGYENEKTPEARKLRAAIGQSAGSMSPQTNDGWVLLGQSGDLVSFGQREGPVGIGSVITVQRQGDTFAPGYSSTGCGGIGYANGQGSMSFQSYTTAGRTLKLRYKGGSCDTRQPTVRVHESATDVDVLLVSPPPMTSTVACAGVGLELTISTELSAPVGSRTVRNIGDDPAQTVLSAATAAAAQRKTDEAEQTAASLCTAAAAGKKVEVSYPTDVATVRAGVPQSRGSWGHLNGFAPAGECYLNNGDGSDSVIVVTDGAPTVTLNSHFTENLLARLPAIPGHPLIP